MALDCAIILNAKFPDSLQSACASSLVFGTKEPFLDEPLRVSSLADVPVAQFFFPLDHSWMKKQYIFSGGQLIDIQEDRYCTCFLSLPVGEGERLCVIKY